MSKSEYIRHMREVAEKYLFADMFNRLAETENIRSLEQYFVRECFRYMVHAFDVAEIRAFYLKREDGEYFDPE